MRLLIKSFIKLFIAVLNLICNPIKIANELDKMTEHLITIVKPLEPIRRPPPPPDDFDVACVYPNSGTCPKCESSMLRKYVLFVKKKCIHPDCRFEE